MKAGASLEKDVQQIYTYLLNMRDEGVVVGNPVFMTGKSGVQHEVDVYYEFSRTGIRHRVAIECKDWATPVSKGQIQEFESKLRDIGNITYCSVYDFKPHAICMNGLTSAIFYAYTYPL